MVSSNCEAKRMFGQLKPSRQAAEVVKRALDLGVDPSKTIRDATQAAIEQGKAKVGMFGGAEEPLRDLGKKLDATQGDRTLRKNR